MFKELKILKLSLFAIFLAIIIWRVSESNKYSVFFSNGISHELSSKIEIIQAGNYNSADETLVIKSLFGNVVYKEDIDFANNIQGGESKADFPKANVKQVELIDSCEAGIYLISDLYSLVIHSKENADITVVYPYANNLIYQDEGYGSVLSNKVVEFNLIAPVLVDECTIGLKELFKFCADNYSVNYITDTELENRGLYSSSKLLVIYGRTSFYTQEMKNNIIEFLNQGGNILLMSSSLANNAIWLENNRVRFSESSFSDDFTISSWLSLGNDLRSEIGLSYRFGGKAKTVLGQAYTISNSSHEVFEGMEGKDVPLSAMHYIGAYCEGLASDSSPIPKNDFYKSELLAFNDCYNKGHKGNVGGMYLIQPDSTSGVILSLGTEDWCLSKNQSNKEVFTISKNAINFLLK